MHCTTDNMHNSLINTSNKDRDVISLDAYGRYGKVAKTAFKRKLYFKRALLRVKNISDSVRLYPVLQRQIDELFRCQGVFVFCIKY